VPAKFKLGSNRDRFPDGPSIASVVEDVVGRRTRFIRLTVTTEGEAYTLFETMNARMLELSGTDLIRNLLFSRVPSESDRDVLVEGWNRIALIVGQEGVPDLMRYHLACTHRHVRERRILQLVEPTLRGPAEVFDLMGALERRGTLLAALHDERDDFWAAFDGRVRDAQALVREYKVLGVKQPTSLLFAAYETFDQEDFLRTLRLVVVMAFRATIVARLSPGTFESVYHQAAQAVARGEARKPRDVWHLLRAMDVPDEKFREDFASLELEGRGARKHLLRYVLASLETKASGRPVNFATDPFTVEHVWPESRGWDWNDAEPPRRIPPPVWRLGNLCPVERELNREAGARSFADKLGTYARSTYALAREIPEVAGDDWTVAAIDARQRRLAELAASIWHVDFTDA
jgi:hypothetical protein